MSGGAGAGAMLDAIRRQRQMQAQMQRRRQSMRGVHVHSDAAYAAMVVRADHPCMHLCEACRYLQDHPGTCDACGGDVLYDLQVHEVAEMVRDEETEARSAVPRAAKWLARGAWLLVGVALVAAYLFWHRSAHMNPQHPRTVAEWFHHYDHAVVLMSILILVATWPLSLFLNRPAAMWVNGHRQAPGFRWRAPIALSAEHASSPSFARARLRGEGQTVTAPFSKRSVLAYQVQVVFDIPGDNHPPQRVLLESGSAPLRAGEARFDADAVFLDVDTPTPVDAPKLSDEELTRFLRARGFYDVDGIFTLHEAVVTEDEEVEVRVIDGHAHVRRVAAVDAAVAEEGALAESQASS